MIQISRLFSFLFAAMVGASSMAQGVPDRSQGAKLFRYCAACHSLEPGVHLTGPSLGNVVGRKAGSLANFHRYSPALKNTAIVWDEKSLDAWLTDPDKLVPGTSMVFRGIPDARARAVLIDYLRTAEHHARGGKRGMGMMRSSGPQNSDLKTAPRTQQVTAVRHCGDAYFVTTAAGKTHTFWEFNLRFKTDSSRYGPYPGKPVITAAGMRGDRAQLVFA